MKKTNDAIKKMRTAHEKQAESIRKKPCYDRVSEDVDIEYRSNRVRRSLFSSSVLRGRRKAVENPPSTEELEAEVATARKNP